MGQRLHTTLKIFLLVIFTCGTLRVAGQNCEVDFPGIAVRNFSFTCGGSSVANLSLGDIFEMGDGDVFTFNAPSVINITGNLLVDAHGNGKIVIPAGVTVNVRGDFQLDPDGFDCRSGNPCMFEIEVNGVLNLLDDLDNDLVNLVWSGTGSVLVDDEFRNSNNGCMACGSGGCPYFDVNAGDCRDNGSSCSNSDFCATIAAQCTSDTINPVFSGCPSNKVVAIVGAGCTQAVTWTPPTATDNCTLASVIPSHTSGTTFSKGIHTVTYTATDAAGNSAVCSFTVTIVDTTAPTISGCLANITVNAGASCQAAVPWTPPTFTDNCAGATMTATKTPGSIFIKGTTTVTYTATDAAGNISTCSFNVTVVDNTSPVISGCPANITVNAIASCQAAVSWSPPTFVDNCTGATMTTTKAPGSIFIKGTTIVTYTATDVAGNTSRCSFNVTVVDNTSPVISGCPANITVNANASCQAVVNWTPPTFVDNCAGSTMTPTKTPGSTFTKGTTVVTYTATDVAGNTSRCSFNVTVVDSTPPVISGCPANITVNANASCQAVVNWTPPTFVDNCTGSTMAPTKIPGSTFTKGTTVVTYTATDVAGNSATCSFNVNVIDNSSPVITGCPGNITVSATASCQAVVNWEVPTVSDNCGSTTLTPSKPSGSLFSLGTTTVTYTATNGPGGSAVCSFNVTVVDTAPPAISQCPTVKAFAGPDCQARVSWPLPTVTDCNTYNLVGSQAPGDSFPFGATEVTYIATDALGYKSTCSFQVVVENELGPAVSNCPSDISREADEFGMATADWTAPGATTGCGELALTSSHTPGQSFTTGTTQVVYTAIDDLGAQTLCTFKVIVSPPEIKVEVGKVITPDGDKINDQLEIVNIEKFKNNQIVIVDRWGSVIFQGNGYDNNKVSWAGDNLTGGQVPTGTYFYTISISYGPQRARKTGFIELIR